jgi:hypothetical protein
VNAIRAAGLSQGGIAVQRQAGLLCLAIDSSVRASAI